MSKLKVVNKEYFGQEIKLPFVGKISIDDKGVFEIPSDKEADLLNALSTSTFAVGSIKGSSSKDVESPKKEEEPTVDMPEEEEPEGKEQDFEDQVMDATLAELRDMIDVLVTNRIITPEDATAAKKGKKVEVQEFILSKTS